MKILYIDNFRGFESTFLSFEDVNFFVGENSTGKTSILKLLGIISSQGFWNYQYFNTDEINFDSFSEIITLNSSKEFFDIGILESTNDNSFSAMKLRFIEKDNMPSLKELSLLNNEINMQITIDGDFLKYRFELLTIKYITEDFFNTWISNNGLNNYPFLRNEFDFLGIRSILFHVQSFINSQLKSEGKDILLKVSIPSFLTNFAWTAPIRATPLKTYDSYALSFKPDGTHTPYVLKEILDNEKDEFGVRRILTKFGLDSGIFDNIIINKLGSGKNKNDAFEIIIMLNGKSLNITNVGYGVSQILPLLVEVIARPDDTWFAIQQPEIHLHPRAQAALGDFIFKSKFIDKQKFIIETHSDYIIDRYRIRINKEHRSKDSKLESSKSQVVFFMRNEKGNRLQTIKINSDGSYSDDQPAEFRDFFINEQFELITI
ncbi:AAA family ATPase [Flavobacterium sp. HBTb2-11-1]|uniref:AAA family ATPase n=1 Tax=Flavobacterium sp. HBTb2-11-1 TaxID=2692212 RepID=UPI00136C1EC4|nr:AAA family ATPase [Flavobacterium sp. HBTb2-11-1]MXO04620.1 AAA family ATPase [Flavobacterium sp. HBTb2-11-1]